MRALAVVVATVLTVALLATLVAVGRRLSTDSGIGSVYGVRFGMSPAQARLDFRAAAQGVWRAASDKEFQLLLWQRTAGTPGGPRDATFVFHDGLLTAVRLTLDEAAARAQARELPSTESVLLTTKQTSAGTVLTYLLRLCDLSQGSSSAADARWNQIDRLLAANTRQVDALSSAAD